MTLAELDVVEARYRLAQSRVRACCGTTTAIREMCARCREDAGYVLAIVLKAQASVPIEVLS